MKKISSVNPATGETIKEYTLHDDAQIYVAIDKAGKAFGQWKDTSFEERSRLMNLAAGHLIENKKKYAEIMTLEMGKPIAEAISEVEKCAWVCKFYADHAVQFLSDESVKTDAAQSYISYAPLGCVLAVMPWNFPFWQVFRFAAPAVMAGNVGILKHASNVPGCALAIEEVFTRCGFPEGVFQTLIIGSDKVERLIAHPEVKAVTLTGSEKAGSQVASLAGKYLKKSVMELGGSDPFIVLADADLPYTCEIAVKARMINTGQSCIAAKRFIVVEEVYDAFLETFVNHISKLKIGDPLDPATQLGPIARENLVAPLLEQIDKSVAAGAKVEYGGKRADLRGAFVLPTVLSNVKPGMPAYHEETFGPVASVIKVKDEEEAIKVANDTSFGLGSSIWTRDTVRAELLARKIEAGSVFINGMVKSDPRLPFGGTKNSGYGRELSYLGIREFMNIKTVWVNSKKDMPEAISE